MLTKINDLVLRLLFEQIPGLKQLDGYKKLIGKWIFLLGGSFAAFAAAFPDYAPLQAAHAAWIPVAGLVLRWAGYEHDASQERRSGE